ncbi:MAG: oligosaccharide flippase family protein, partial [Terriglobales bacterium]
NRAVQAAQGEVVVFTDANNRFAPQALARLAAPFADSRVGAVVGRKGVEAQAGVGGGESVYWRYEGWLTGQESASGCAAGFYGEALALRRRAYQPLPAAQMVNDDLWLGLAAMARGWRVVAAPEAHSIELGSAHTRAEWERRRRMAVGHWAALAVLRRRWQRLGLANAAKLVCHQILRPLSALWLLLALASGLLVLVAPAGAVDGGVRAVAWLQLVGWAWVGMVGLARAAGARLGRAEAPYFFCLALLAGLAGGWRYLRRRQSPLWQRVERAGDAGMAPAASDTPGAAMSTGHILHGLFWASSSFLLGKLLVFGSVVVLARLLAPQAFGAVALATSAVTVLEILATLGMTSALIFEDQSVYAAADLCFWITLAASLLELGGGWAAAPWLARFFHEPELTGMVRALLACVLLLALGNTHNALLRRQLAFRAKLLPDLGQAFVKGTLAVALALLGWGAWSLIWSQVLGTAVCTLLLWRITPWRPHWHFERPVAVRMAHYAKHIYLLDGSSVLLTHLDTLTIGKMLSDTLLGFYTLAYRLPEVVLLSVLAVISRVIFPAFSRLQDSRAHFRATLLDTCRFTALLTLPLAAGLGVLAGPIIYSIYGWRWGPSVAVLQVLALYGGIRCITHHFGDAYKSMGRPDVLTRTTVAWWIILPPSLILGARWGGIVGVAWGQVATRVAMSGLHVYLVWRYLKISPAALWQCFAPALEATAAMAAGLWLVLPRFAGWAPRPELLVLVPFGALLYVATLLWRHPRVVRSVLSRLRNIRPTIQGRQGGRLPMPTPAAAPAAATAYAETRVVMGQPR